MNYDENAYEAATNAQFEKLDKAQTIAELQEVLNTWPEAKDFEVEVRKFRSRKGENMKYNEKYDRYVTKGGLVYRYDSKQDKLVLCKQNKLRKYLRVKVSKPERRDLLVHILVWETFVGNKLTGYEIDHINTNKYDNKLINLRCVTHSENMLNPITRKHLSESTLDKPWSDFGKKFKEHYGFTHNADRKLYDKEKHYFYKHKRCSWEAEDANTEREQHKS